MEHQQLLALHLRKSKGFAATSTHKGTKRRISRQKWLRGHRRYILNNSVKGASTISCLAPCIIKGLRHDMNP